MNKSSFSILVFFVILFIGAALAYTMHISFEGYASYFVFAVTFFLAYVVSASINIANQWDRAIVLRLGRFHSLRGPGMTALTMGLGKKQPSDVKENEIENRLRESNEG